MTSPNVLYAAACAKFPQDHQKASEQFVEWMLHDGHIERQPRRLPDKPGRPAPGSSRPPLGFGR